MSQAGHFKDFVDGVLNYRTKPTFSIMDIQDLEGVILFDCWLSLVAPSIHFIPKVLITQHRDSF